jgi:hypothetical protein
METLMSSFSTWPPRRRRTVIAAAVVIVAVIALVIALAANGGSSHTARRSSPPGTAGTPPGGPGGSGSAGRSGTNTTTAPSPPAHTVPALPATEDPVAYARAVADVLFTVDPAQISRQQFLDYWKDQAATVVYADAAKLGLTLPEQTGDVLDNLTQGWIPSESVWQQEAAAKTKATFRITSVNVPDYWVNAVADGKFTDPGLRMERVLGVLTQTYGPDPKHPAHSARSVSIDIGLLCAPTQPGGCRLIGPQKPPGADDGSGDTSGGS